LKLERIPITQAEPDPQAQVRVYYNTEDLEDDIARRGQIEPVLAYRKGEKYIVYVGIRRYYAIRRLYERQGRPDFILALVEEQAPSPVEKMEKIFSENDVRSPLSIYDLIDIILFKRDIADILARGQKISTYIFRRGRELRNYGITEEELRRWSEIEIKVSGEIRLNINHIEKVAALAPEKRDFAVAVLSAKNIPASAIFNLETVLMNAAIDRSLIEKLKQIGIRNPYEREQLGGEMKGQQFEIEKQGEVSDRNQQSGMQRIESSPAEMREGAAEGPAEGKNVEEMPPTVVVFENDCTTIWLHKKLYMFYNGAEPDVVKVPVEDDQVIEVEGRRFRFRVMKAERKGGT